MSASSTVLEGLPVPRNVLVELKTDCDELTKHYKTYEKSAATICSYTKEVSKQLDSWSQDWNPSTADPKRIKAINDLQTAMTIYANGKGLRASCNSSLPSAGRSSHSNTNIKPSPTFRKSESVAWNKLIKAEMDLTGSLAAFTNVK